MKTKIVLCFFSAIFLLVEVNCIQVVEENSSSTQKTENEPQSIKTIMETATESPKEMEKSHPIESRETPEHEITTSTSTTTQKISPTLKNTRLDLNHETSEKPIKSLRDFA